MLGYIRTFYIFLLTDHHYHTGGEESILAAGGASNDAASANPSPIISDDGGIATLAADMQQKLNLPHPPASSFSSSATAKANGGSSNGSSRRGGGGSSSGLPPPPSFDQMPLFPQIDDEVGHVHWIDTHTLIFAHIFLILFLPSSISTYSHNQLGGGPIPDPSAAAPTDFREDGAAFTPMSPLSEEVEDASDDVRVAMIGKKERWLDSFSLQESQP